MLRGSVVDFPSMATLIGHAPLRDGLVCGLRRSAGEDEREPALERIGEPLAHRTGLEALDERGQEALDHELPGDAFGQPRERR